MITWTKLRGGIWHGVRAGQVVAVVERARAVSARKPAYALTIAALGLKVWGASAAELRACAEQEMS